MMSTRQENSIFLPLLNTTLYKCTFQTRHTTAQYMVFSSKTVAYIYAKKPIIACVLHSTIDHQTATDFVE